jgi:hypothetical protein
VEVITRLYAEFAQSNIAQALIVFVLFLMVIYILNLDKNAKVSSF